MTESLNYYTGEESGVIPDLKKLRDAIERGREKKLNTVINVTYQNASDGAPWANSICGDLNDIDSLMSVVQLMIERAIDRTESADSAVAAELAESDGQE